ncbi:MAG: hypothetical protein M1814_003670 [Vezdaea aestivalis]|nr:MAG: hypothetical protein M1814_003670 [Vezdaea aestivalis]
MAEAYQVLLQKWTQLEREVALLEEYQAPLPAHQRTNLKNFKSLMKREFKPIANLTPDDITDPQQSQTIKANNLSHYFAIWETAKRYQDVVGLKVKVAVSPPRSDLPNGSISNGTAPSKGSPITKTVLVDAIIRTGAEWLKVSLVDSLKLGYQIADSGWDPASPLEAGYEPTLLKSTMALLDAASLSPTHSSPPTVNLILPNLHPPLHPSITTLLSTLRTQSCKITLPTSLPALPPLTSTLLQLLTPSPISIQNPTLLLDTSILISLVSDIAHNTLPLLPDPPPERLRAQIADEKRRESLEGLWETLRGRRLVCTELVASTARRTVERDGSGTERTRLEGLFLREGGVKALRGGSQRLVPVDLRLPVEVLEVGGVVESIKLPEWLSEALGKLSDTSAQMLALGWSRDWVTVTCSRDLGAEVQRCAVHRGERWPVVWTHEARNLVGRELRTGSG